MASYTAAVDALTDVTAGETLDDAGGGLGHAEVENRQNAAARDLATWADGISAGTVTSVNGQTGDVSFAGIVYREYDGGWPVRGTVPTGAIVMWIKRDSGDPDPPIDATYALAGTDIALLAQA